MKRQQRGLVTEDTSFKQQTKAVGEASQTVGLIYLIYAMAQMRQRRVTQKSAIEKEPLVRFGRVKDGLEGDSAPSVHTKMREEQSRTEGARKKTKLRVQQVQQGLKSADCNCEPTAKRMGLQFGGQGVTGGTPCV